MSDQSIVVCGVDFETQHDDAKTCNITEVGALLADRTHLIYHRAEGENDRLIEQEFTELGRVSTLCWDTSYPPQDPFIVELTGITDEMLKSPEQCGVTPQQALQLLFPLVEKAQYVFAHNKQFDETVYYAASERYGLNPPKRPWICTWTEIDYAPKYRCKQLSHLAFDHRIEFDPDSLHRAFDDVRLMLQLVSKYPLEDILAYVNEPWVYIQAIFPPPFGSTAIAGQIGKAKAQKLKYGWEKAPGDTREFSKQWMKRVKHRYVAREIKNAELVGLTIRVLDN